MGTTDISLERVFRQLIAGNVGMAIAETEIWLAAWPHAQSREKLDGLKAEYKLMENYWQQGIKDPQLDAQYQRLLQRLYVLCGNIAIHRHMAASSFLQAQRTQARQPGHNWALTAVRKEMEDFVSEVAMLELEPEHLREVKSKIVYRAHQQQMNALFNYVVTANLWTDGVGQDLEQILLSPTVDSNDQQLLVSAITLSLMNRFDMVKFRVLVNVYQQAQDEEVRQRALVGWVMGIDDDWLRVFPEQRELVATMLQSKRVCKELTELQMQLVYTLNAEKDTTIVQQEIMPELLKNNSFRMTPNGLEEVEDNELEDVLHPDAAEKRMEQLESSFQRMMDMQKQGADVYFGGFSQMKRYPFFYDMSNWLVPFYMQHPDIAQYTEKVAGNRFIETLLKTGTFCNSDKYSFLMAAHQVINQLPASLRDMMQRGEASMSELVEMPQRTPAYIRRIYLMDLYRFFRLFPNRSALCNPFDITSNELGMCLFFTSALFVGTPLEASKREVVAMLMKQKLKTSAKVVLDTFPKEMYDVQYYLWTEKYTEALALDPDNERALAAHARETYDRGEYDEAVSCYDRLILLHPDKMRYKLYKAVCLVELKDYEDALQLLFQLNYEHQEDVHVSRSLAWALTCDGKLEQAERIYQQLTDEGKLSANDWLNKGYCLWLEGRIADAAASFRKYIELSGMKTTDMLSWEVSFLSERGITDTDMKMMETLVMG